MGRLSLEEMQHNVLEAEKGATRAKADFGEESPEYRTALKKFAVAWFVLKKTREPEAFLHEILV